MVGGTVACGVHGVAVGIGSIDTKYSSHEAIRLHSVLELSGGITKWEGCLADAEHCECARICSHRPTPRLRLRTDEMVESVGDRRGILAPDRGAAVCLQARLFGV